MIKRKTNRNPILPRSKSDPIGMGRNVRKMFSDIEERYYKIKLDIKNLLDRKVIPRSIIGVNEKSVIVCSQFTEVPMLYFVNSNEHDYNFTSEEFAKFSDEIQKILEDWLLEESRTGELWFELYLEESQKAATLSTHSSLSQQSDLYLTQRPLYQILFSEPYLERLAIAQQLFYEQWRGLTYQTKSDLIYTISEAVVRGVNVKKTAELISKRLDISMSRAKKIAQTEQLSIYRRAEWEEAKAARDELGLDAGILHISALKSTTRITHAKRHGKVFTPEEQEAWYQKDGNRFNCYCKSQVIIKEDTPLSTLKRYENERKAWLKTH
ncbi:phage head morphogenesis protein [Pasteurella multocida]|nr:phage head morphogenesis protein [Pasteurella multocida]